ncbi:major facilitator superfamily domain-containing protein [Mucidula mucida]|nr:major facilitator superfamily domain-containing protein [Mucidula mucida]
MASYAPLYIPSAQTSITVLDDNATLHDQSVQTVVEGKEAIDPFLVTIGPDDPADPKNWSRIKRWTITMLGGILVLNALFFTLLTGCSASGILPEIMAKFTFSQEVGTLVISVFVAGFCVGPLLWGPLSEEYGRVPIFRGTFFVYACFQLGMALAPNTASLIVFRFLGGVFASGPLTNSGAVISDMWNARDRGKALAFFVIAPFAVPAIGPTVSGFISVRGADWRWLFWTLAIFAGVCWLLILIVIPETYKPILLVEKARRLRKETGDTRYYAPMERNKKTISQQIENVLGRPFKMLAREPMLIATTVYMSFVYGCLYLLFEAYPIVFREGHGFNAGITGLMFLPILLGAATSTVLYLAVFNPKYEREIERYAPHPVPAESRLRMSLFASPLFAVSFFIFGWTSYPHLSFFNYIIDTYVAIAASALTSNTVCRSLFGAGFPLFATQMYNSLTPRWASTLIGFVALFMVPIPFVFVKYGATLRKKSRYAPFKDGPTPPVETPSKESDTSPA